MGRAVGIGAVHQVTRGVAVIGQHTSRSRGSASAVAFIVPRKPQQTPLHGATSAKVAGRTGYLGVVVVGALQGFQSTVKVVHLDTRLQLLSPLYHLAVMAPPMLPLSFSRTITYFCSRPHIDAASDDAQHETTPGRPQLVNLGRGKGQAGRRECILGCSVVVVYRSTNPSSVRLHGRRCEDN